MDDFCSHCAMLVGDETLGRGERQAVPARCRRKGLEEIADSGHRGQAFEIDGDLSRVVRAVKLVGFVNSTADFIDQPKVINGASDFMVAALGDAGRHARSAVSAASLPLGVAVEIEGIFQIRSA
ncbi:MAG: RidA family protein [Brevundimonas sp.]|uniref:RidA family protein n=1 Tax=Brevundimonas sp. TaxID=1871086 RepID=UPI00273690E7|nr:RidA family protein [Brevundimonas sp.]MDP3379196.1 RidA family protein [Brevundimonas sp.]